MSLAGAEWIKLWSLRSTRWVLAAGVLLLTGLAVQSSLDVYAEWPSFRPQEKAMFNPMTEAFSALGAIVVMTGAGSVGALTVTGEYATGLIRTTFTAVPARGRVLAAKVLVVAGVMLAAGTLVALTTYGASQAILSGRGTGGSIGDPYVVRALVANALLAPVSALAGMGIGALLRHTAATVVAVCGVLVILPTLFKPTVHQWANDLYAMFPFYVWRTCLSAVHACDKSALPTATGSWAVFALWPLVSAAVTLIVVRRRDV
ncbi:ABC transporter permease [Nonomuraea rosea]|uniref:ABC transporter permease n=1 Tax=Nonomuraea rosea TaxID=638574 RepID=A0ABP6Z1X6_9ACTN